VRDCRGYSHRGTIDGEGADEGDGTATAGDEGGAAIAQENEDDDDDEDDGEGEGALRRSLTEARIVVVRFEDDGGVDALGG